MKNITVMTFCQKPVAEYFIYCLTAIARISLMGRVLLCDGIRSKKIKRHAHE